MASSIKSPQSPTVSDVCLFEIEKSGARLLAVLLSTNKREAGVEDEWKKGGGQKAGAYLLHSPFLFAVDFVVVNRRSAEENFCAHGLALANSVSKQASNASNLSPQGQSVYASIDSSLCLMAFTSMF